MHSMGIHSALAIKRQRRRRDDVKKKKERRYSIQSTESGGTDHSPRGSTRRKNRNPYAKKHKNGEYDSNVGTSIGMLHIGVVFLVFGVFLLGAGLIPDDVSQAAAWSIFAKDSWWNELVCTGLFAMGIGIFLIVLNSIISKKEDEDLENYVQKQLTRSRSGHRLERDVETGGLQTRQTRKQNQINKGYEERGLDNLSHCNEILTPNSSEVLTPTTPASALGASGEMLLEKIMEEDSSCGDEYRHHHQQHDKRHLLNNGHSNYSHHNTHHAPSQHYNQHENHHAESQNHQMSYEEYAEQNRHTPHYPGSVHVTNI